MTHANHSSRRTDSPSVWAAVVLAAGKGTRMKSGRHKVLHPLAGKPMLWYVLRALLEAGISVSRTVVVVGDQAEAVESQVEGFELPEGEETYRFALQEPQLGTGHAVECARQAVPMDTRWIVVAYGDTPLLQGETVRRIMAAHEEQGAPLTLVTGRVEGPSGYGRVVRDASGRVRGIVEERDATAEQRAIQEVNSGFCAFDADWLWRNLPEVQPAPNGERYLTALPAIAGERGEPVATVEFPSVAETMGVNTREQLAEAEATLRQRINRSLMATGVTLQDAHTTYVDAGVSIGPDTTIYANTHLSGETRIGAECEIGPNTVIRDSEIANRCRVLASVLDRARLEEDVSVGPFAHLRPGTHCGRAAEVGTGSEIKASTLGAGSRMHHFGYLGDSVVGSNVNVGAGAITCNYDGVRKHRTTIEPDAFIGSGTLLIAPVTVGAGALTGAGAVVTKDVEPDTTVVGVPARVVGKRKRSRQDS